MGRTLPLRGGPRTSALARPPIGTCGTRSGTSRRAAGESVNVAGTAACPAMALPAMTGGPRRGRGLAMGSGRGTGTSIRGRGTLPVTAGRRRRAPSSAGPLTPTARSSGTLLVTAASPSPVDSRCYLLGLIGKPASRPSGWGRPSSGTDTCSADTTPGFPAAPLAPRASCGVNSATLGSRAGTSPTTPAPWPATCAASTSRTWTSAGGARAGWTVGSLRLFPSYGGRAPAASAPGTRTDRSTSSSAGTRWSGPGATARLARRAGT